MDFGISLNTEKNIWGRLWCLWAFKHLWLVQYDWFSLWICLLTLKKSTSYTILTSPYYKALCFVKITKNINNILEDKRQNTAIGLKTDIVKHFRHIWPLIDIINTFGWLLYSVIKHSCTIKKIFYVIIYSCK